MKRTILVIAKWEIRRLATSTRSIMIWAIYMILGVVTFITVNGASSDEFSPIPIASGLIIYIPLAIPIVGIVMGFDHPSFEIESGSLELLLVYPISRKALFLGKSFARLALSWLPVILTTTALALTESALISEEAIVRLAILEVVMMLGISVWFTLASTISTITKSSSATLAYCGVFLGVISYSLTSYVFIDGLVSLLTGHIVLPLAGFPKGSDYLLQFRALELLPSVSLGSVIVPLLQGVPSIGFRYATLSNWLVANTGDSITSGLPVYQLILYLVVLVIAFMISGLYWFQKNR